MTLKEIVKNNKVYFSYYRAGHLYYTVTLKNSDLCDYKKKRGYGEIGITIDLHSIISGSNPDSSTIWRGPGWHGLATEVYLQCKEFDSLFSPN